MKKIFDQFFLFTFMIILIMIFSNTFFSLPPLGKLLDPYVGVVQNQGDETGDRSIKVDYRLRDSIHVYFDDRMVPHIFANNPSDLAFAQGYVVSKLRLWQMDFLVRSTAGELAEVLSHDYLEFDRNQRRLGYLQAAKMTLALMENEPKTRDILDSFTSGVNTYLKNLPEKLIPVEFKILGYKPEEWTNLKTVLVMKFIIGNLSGYEEDEKLTKLKLLLGDSEFRSLFPNRAADFEPLVRYKDKGFGLNTSFNDSSNIEFLNEQIFNSNQEEVRSAFNPHYGSNSWVVSGKKTKNGFPILSNDPHLGLNLPSIWVEMQLICKDFNAYGVTIPGIPAILIGYNNNIAWGITNGGLDVKDWYRMNLSKDYTRYCIDGEWKNTTVIIDTIRVKNSKNFIDTTYYVPQGPIVYDNNFKPGSTLKDFALRWQLHEAANDLRAFTLINQSKNLKDFKLSISNFKGTLLNFTFASNSGDIAAFLQGNYPVKLPHQGKFLMDGGNTKELYNKYIPFDQLPHIENPKNQMIISANQTPTDEYYPYYYNGYFVESRAKSIKASLEGSEKLDLNQMKIIQLDNSSYFASLALPELIDYIKEENLNPTEAHFLSELKAWNYQFNYESRIAGFYYLWWENVKKLTWDEFDDYGKTPADFTLLEFIRKQPQNRFFDLTDTEKLETAFDIVKRGFKETVKQYTEEDKSKGTKWGIHNPVDFTHFLKIQQMGSLNNFSSGHPDAINSISKNWGPSWRMIVEMGDKAPIGYGIYPGGQSGNPGSKYYRNSIYDWSTGRYYRHNFFQTLNDAKSNSVKKLTFYNE